MSSFQWSPLESGGGGVEIYANIASFPAATGFPAGTLAVAADTGYLYEGNGSVWTVIAGAGATLSVGTIDSGTASANGAHIDGNALIMQSASATVPGVINVSTQTLAGAKTFTSTLNANAGIDRSSAGTLTIGATNSTTINIGNAGAVVNIQGTTIYENTPILLVADPLITVNSGGGVGSGQDSGIQIEENAVVTGYNQTSSDRNSWTLKAPATAGVVTITPGASGFVVDQASHDPVTLAAVGSSPNANAATITGQALNLQPADASNPGVLTAGTQTIGGAKTFSTSVSSPSHVLTGSSSGALTLVAAATTSDYTLTMPSSQGAIYSVLTNDGAGVATWSAPLSPALGIQNYTLACSVLGNALTIELKTIGGADPTPADPVAIIFRNATATSGLSTRVLVTSALSITVPSGATLGRTTAALNWPMYVWFINNGGAAEFAVSTSPAYASLVTTTTISAGSTSISTMYSATGRSAAPVTSAGVLTINLATQTTYNVAPTEVVLTNGVLDAATGRQSSPLLFKSSLAGGIAVGGMALGADALNVGSGISIGSGSSCLADNSVTLGVNASCTSSGGGPKIAIGAGASVGLNAARSIAIGGSATTASADSIAIGGTASAVSVRTISIGSSSGRSSAGSADGSIAIGAGCDTGAFTNSITLTPSSDTTPTVAATANNQFCLGDSRTLSQISDIRLGRGAVPTSNAIDVTMGITGISGSNATGKNFILQAGNGTGSGGSGQILFQTAPVAASSSTANTMATRAGFDNAGGFFINGTTSGALTIKAAAATTSHTLTMPSAQGAANSYLSNNGSGTLAWTAFVAPTIQKFTSGSGTYTTPTSPRTPLYLKVRMVGGGGGGGGSGTTNGTAATVGGDTTFGAGVLSAGGGAIGARGTPGGAGGTSSLGAAVGTALAGGLGSAGAGYSGVAVSALMIGGTGGTSAFGGGGGAGSGIAGLAGRNGTTNTGGGGGGAATDAVTNGQDGSGGGAGGYVDAILTAPAATYAYAVGVGGTGQLAGTSGGAGGNGGSGYIEVIEYYQ